MHEKDLYKKFLGMDKSWFNSEVTMDDAALTIELLVEFRGEQFLRMLNLQSKAIILAFKASRHSKLLLAILSLG
jgi:hypothetical protein